jgi:hypothetical protein
MTKRLCGVMLAGWLALPAAAEAPLTPTDFAEGYPIHVQGGQALHELVLPAEVHRGVTRADLGDVRVFNRDGQIVPHAFRETPAESRTPPRLVLPHFTLTGAASARQPDLQMTVRTRADGTIVDVRTGERGRAGATRTAAHVLDASQARQPIRALELGWTAPADGFYTGVEVEASDDLQHWRRIIRAPVASLEQGGHRLEQRRIELGGLSAKYLRLRWTDAAVPVISAVAAELVPAVPPPRLDWQRVAVTPGDGGPGGLRFDVTGPLRIERVRIQPPEQNSVAQVELLSRADARQPWRSRGSVLVYRLAVDGRRIEQQEIALAPSDDRQWLVRIANRESAFGSRLPEIDVAYRPAQLVFVARGEAPFLLAYGSGRAGPAARPLEALLREMTGEGARPKAVPAPATLGPPRVLGGPEARRSPLSPRDWKVIALWAALAAGVLLLAWMARRLFRQMSAPGAGSGRE